MTDPADDALRRGQHAPGALLAELGRIEDELSYDVDAWWVRAREIERDAEALGAEEAVLRARLVQADVRQRRGEIAAAAPVFWAANRWAAERKHGPVLARSHLMLQRLYRDLGDAAAALDHAVRGVELLAESASTPQQVYHLIALATSLQEAGSYDAARERFLQAERLTADAGDVSRRLLVLNNLADNELMAGEVDRASTAVERLRAVAAEAGHGLDTEATYLGTVAEVQIARGAYADAEQTAHAALRAFHAAGYEEAHALANHLLTLATAQRHRGHTAAAQETLDRCTALCEGRALGWITVLALREQATLHEVRGDLGHALATYKAYHAADKELVSQQREAQARTRHAMFETAEARRDAERFREQARRDPLTGLRNRRYVDEQLPALVEHAARSGDAVLAALVDLDHFKRINDTLSHDVGDQVLVAVAGLIAAAVPAAPVGLPAFAARMGGEEFLLVLTGMSPAEAVARVEALRAEVAGHPWRPVTGDLPVTVSVGVAAARPDSTQAELLSRADAHLYAAKHAGRNQVRTDPETTEPVERRRYRDSPPPA